MNITLDADNVQSVQQNNVFRNNDNNLAAQLNKPNPAAIQQLLARPVQTQFATIQIDSSTVPLQQNNAFRPPSELSIQLEDDGAVLSASTSLRDA